MCQVVARRCQTSWSCSGHRFLVATGPFRPKHTKHEFHLIFIARQELDSSLFWTQKFNNLILRLSRHGRVFWASDPKMWSWAYVLLVGCLHVKSSIVEILMYRQSPHGPQRATRIQWHGGHGDWRATLLLQPSSAFMRSWLGRAWSGTSTLPPWESQYQELHRSRRHRSQDPKKARASPPTTTKGREMGHCDPVTWCIIWSVGSQMGLVDH